MKKLYYFKHNTSYKFKCDFTMCADSGDVWDTTIIRDAFTGKLEKYDTDDDLHRKRHHGVTTSDEAHSGQLRKVSSRRPDEEGILQSELPGSLSKPHRLRSSFGR